MPKWNAIGRRELAPLRYPAFRRVLVGQAVSNAGSWMQAVAAGWLVFRLTDSAAAVGALTALARAPALLLAGYGGALADRFDRRRLAIALFALQAIPPTLLAALAWTGSISTWHIYVLVGAVGVLAGVSSPVVQVILPSTVPRELLQSANSLSGAAYSTAGVLGPLIAGGLVAAVGVEGCFAVDAGTYMLLIGVFATLSGALGRGERRGGGGVREALGQAARHPRLRVLLGSAALVCLLAGPIRELTPAIAHRHGSGAEIIGYLLAALAGGGLLGNLLTGSLVRAEDLPRRQHATGAAALLLGGSLSLLAASGQLLLALLAMASIGFLYRALWIHILGWVEHDAPAEMSGRMVGAFYALSAGGVSLGALGVGALFDSVSMSAGLLACAIPVAAFGLWMALRPVPRTLLEPSP